MALLNNYIVKYTVESQTVANTTTEENREVTVVAATDEVAQSLAEDFIDKCNSESARAFGVVYELESVEIIYPKM